MFASRSQSLAVMAAVLSSCLSMNSVTAFVAPAVLAQNKMSLVSSESSTLLRDSEEDRAAPLPLSASDLQRLTALKTRHQTIPLMIMDSMVPGQTISFQRLVGHLPFICVCWREFVSLLGAIVVFQSMLFIWNSVC